MRAKKVGNGQFAVSSLSGLSSFEKVAGQFALYTNHFFNQIKCNQVIMQAL
jgi:hypothetical protein